MSPLRIYHDDRDDVTVISNMFIDEYMKDANDAQIKIFLFLIRMIGADRTTSIADIADIFNYPEQDVIRALRYWEKKRLLEIDYNEQKTPIAIRFLNTLKQKPPEILPLQHLPVVAFPVPEVTPPPNPVYIKPTFTKPVYSLDDLQAFKDAEETSQLLHIVEQYLGKTLSSNDIMSIFFFTDTLGFSIDLVDHLIQYCVERGKKDFRYIEKVAIGWAEEGITTPKQAVRATRKYDKIVYDVMKALGKQSAPTNREAEFILRWVREFGFSADIIYEACERTVMAVDQHRFEYCNKILANWKEQNVRNKTDIQKLDAAYAIKRTNQTQTSSRKNSGGTLLVNQFKQNQYDFEALEREFVSN
jgi:DnaD/phage-associated family protein